MVSVVYAVLHMPRIVRQQDQIGRVTPIAIVRGLHQNGSMSVEGVII